MSTDELEPMGFEEEQGIDTPMSLFGRFLKDLSERVRSWVSARTVSWRMLTAP